MARHTAVALDGIVAVVLLVLAVLLVRQWRYEASLAAEEFPPPWSPIYSPTRPLD